MACLLFVILTLHPYDVFAAALRLLHTNVICVPKTHKSFHNSPHCARRAPVHALRAQRNGYIAYYYTMYFSTTILLLFCCCCCEQTVFCKPCKTENVNTTFRHDSKKERIHPPASKLEENVFFLLRDPLRVEMRDIPSLDTYSPILSPARKQHSCFFKPTLYTADGVRCVTYTKSSHFRLSTFSCHYQSQTKKKAKNSTSPTRET